MTTCATPNRKITSLCSPVEIADWLGTIVTFLAMVPQGGFGGVLADRLWFKDLPKAARLTLDLFMFIAASTGKFAIVRYYNTPKFRAIAEAGVLAFLKQCDPRTWTPRGVVNGAFTLNMAVVFAGLARLSLSGIDDVPHSGVVQLLRSYDDKLLDQVAKVIGDRGLQAPFVASAFFANIFSFPPIHDGIG